MPTCKITRATRISLALAFSRIFAPEDPTHIYAIGLAITFAGAFVAVIVRGVIHCSHMSSWLFNTGLVQCNFSRRIIIAMITGVAFFLWVAIIK